jgi:hypothetical protein
MLTGYRRTTRFQKDYSPRYLAMHEFDTPSMPPEIKLVLGTKWSKEILGTANSTSSDMWEFITETGKGATGESF